MPKPEIRDTRNVRRVLLVLLSGASELSGYQISHLAGVSPHGVYLILARLGRAGWADSEWQQNPPPGQPGRRRFHHLTRQGHAKAIGLLRLDMPRQRILGYILVALSDTDGTPGLPTGAQLHTDPGSARRKADGGRYVIGKVTETEDDDDA